MRVMVWSAKRVGRWGILSACVLMTVLFLQYPQAIQNGVRHGMAICSELLIPSIFPFLVLSGFIIRSGVAGGISRRVAPLMRRIFGLSGGAATAMIIALMGGYPAGATAVAGLCEQGEIDIREARRLLRCCISAGPAFVIGGIGVGMLGSVKAGVLLLVAHWLAFIIVALTERDSGAPSATHAVHVQDVGTALAQSVHTAAFTLLSMSGFVLLASGVLSLLDAMVGETQSRFWLCLVACVTEVSTGCVEAAQMGATAPFWIGAALGFGGVSVHGQIAACTATYRLIDRGFFRARLLHALLGGCLSTVLFWKWHPVGVATGAALSAFAPQSVVGGASGLAAMMLMCVLFLMTLPKSADNADQPFGI